jgi:hypothetical protein
MLVAMKNVAPAAKPMSVKASAHAAGHIASLYAPGASLLYGYGDSAAPIANIALP